jgi:diguanylate cyclase (GGDEF)-like protein
MLREGPPDRQFTQPAIEADKNKPKRAFLVERNRGIQIEADKLERTLPKKEIALRLAKANRRIADFRASEAQNVRTIFDLTSQLQSASEAHPVILQNEFEKRFARDKMSGALSKEGFKSRVESYHRLGTTCCVVLVDLNRFKIINDTHGHLVGNSAIKAAGKMLNEFARFVDLNRPEKSKELSVVGRVGGDEFCIIIPDLLPAQAAELFQRFKSSPENQCDAEGHLLIKFTHNPGQEQEKENDIGEPWDNLYDDQPIPEAATGETVNGDLGLSMGIANLEPANGKILGKTFKSAYHTADQLMYAAKLVRTEVEYESDQPKGTDII